MNKEMTASAWGQNGKKISRKECVNLPHPLLGLDLNLNRVRG